jgi:NTP pyrophosphatase (non-canonical NTP hydrolase)
MNQMLIINRILRERSRQDKLHIWDADTNKMAVLAEELGEVAAAMQGQGNLQDELVQLAAVAIRWLEYEQSILQEQSMAE